MAPALNSVFRAWDANEAVRVVGGDVTITQQHLETTQRTYTKEVEALLRAGAKQGLHHCPAGEELQLLLLKEV
jgi:thiamine monophosphate kinase